MDRFINKVIQGDCLEVMKDIPDKSIDMILCDLPYGTTRNQWDSIIDIDNLWAQYKRVIKNSGVILLTATAPFNAAISSKNIESYKYSWYWKKPHTGQLNAKRMPLKNVEEVLVFYSMQPTYNPQFSYGEPYKVKRRNYKGNESYGKQKDHNTVSDGRRYPMQILEFGADKVKLHPTQKPVALFEYLIKTYTNECDIVLDNCAGSGTTGVACKNLNRNYILIEKEPDYIDIINKRLLTN